MGVHLADHLNLCRALGTVRYPNFFSLTPGQQFIGIFWWEFGMSHEVLNTSAIRLESAQSTVYSHTAFSLFVPCDP